MAHAVAPTPLTVLTQDGLLFGCDYNPEQWDPAVWREDVALMREIGIGLVAINIFGWSSINPAPGVWDFSLLDEVLDLLHEGGIRVNLGTGTASPPPWLSTRHPEILPTADDGTRRFPGGRRWHPPRAPASPGSTRTAATGSVSARSWAPSPGTPSPTRPGSRRPSRSSRAAGSSPRSGYPCRSSPRGAGMLLELRRV